MAWPGGARAAVSLTYDGGSPIHRDVVEPLLREHGLRATFYVDAKSLLDHLGHYASLDRWGAEIGNHSLFRATGPEGDLPNWTLQMVEDDLDMTESLFANYLPGPASRSFAYPGLHPISAEGSFEPVVERRFSWAKTRQEGFNHGVFCRLNALRSIDAGKCSGAVLAHRLEEVLDMGAWAIFSFQGRQEWPHEFLVRRLLALGDELYIAPVREVGQTVAAARGRITLT